jgi:hypothetical protein
VTLFTDWNSINEHAAVRNDAVWIESIQTLRRHLAELRAAHPSVPKGLDSVVELENTGLDRTSHVANAGQLLMRSRFYAPLTSDLISIARKTGQSWAYLPFDFNKTKLTEERRRLEQTHDAMGHWKYGIQLESFYCSSHSHRYYSAYFVHESTTNSLLVIGASSESEERAKRVRLLDHLIPLMSKYKKPAFSVAHAKKQAAKLTFQKLAGKVPISSDGERARYIQCKNAFEALSVGQLDHLAVEARDKLQGQYPVPLDKLTVMIGDASRVKD